MPDGRTHRRPCTQQEMVLDLAKVLPGTDVRPVWEKHPDYRGQALFFTRASGRSLDAMPPGSKLALLHWLELRGWRAVLYDGGALLAPAEESGLLSAFRDACGFD